MREGISAALQAGFRKMEVEGDNQIVLRAVQKQSSIPWQIAPIIEDIWNMLSTCQIVTFKHIYREENMATDWMAKHGCSIRSHSLSIFFFPPKS